MSITSYDGESFIILFVIAYFLQQIVSGLILPSQEALTLNSVTDQNRDKYSRYQYWLTNISLSIGVIIGGIFYQNSKYLLFFALSIVVFINIFILIKYIKNDFDIKRKFDFENLLKGTIKTYINALKDKNYSILLLGFSLVLLIELSMNSYLVVKLKEEFHKVNFLNISINGVLMFSILIVTNTIIVALLSLYIGKVSEKLSFKRNMYLSVFTYSLGYMIVLYSNNIYILVIAMLIASLGEMIYAPKYTSLRISLIPNNKRGSYSSLNALASQFSSLLARLTLILYSFVSSSIIASLLFVVSIIGFMIILSIHESLRKLT